MSLGEQPANEDWDVAKSPLNTGQILQIPALFLHGMKYLRFLTKWLITFIFVIVWIGWLTTCWVLLSDSASFPFCNYSYIFCAKRFNALFPVIWSKYENWEFVLVKELVQTSRSIVCTFCSTKPLMTLRSLDYSWMFNAPRIVVWFSLPVRSASFKNGYRRIWRFVNVIHPFSFGNGPVLIPIELRRCDLGKVF